jgi:hypothetical protein
LDVLILLIILLVFFGGGWAVERPNYDGWGRGQGHLWYFLAVIILAVIILRLLGVWV